MAGCQPWMKREGRRQLAAVGIAERLFIVVVDEEEEEPGPGVMLRLGRGL